MHLSVLAFVASSLGGVLAAPTIKSYAVKERHVVPRGWNAVSRAPSSHVVDLQIGLKQRNQDKLEQHVTEVSDPSHARYGQYLSAAEIEDLIAPAGDTLELVHAWLLEHDISKTVVSPTKDWVTVTLPVESIERLLDTTYSVFRHSDGSELVRTSEWSLPEHLHEHIDLIQPTTSFFRPFKNARGVMPEDGEIDWHGGPWNKGGQEWWKGTPYHVSRQCARLMRPYQVSKTTDRVATEPGTRRSLQHQPSVQCYWHESSW